MGYLSILLTILFLTMLLLFVSNSSLFNSNRNNAKDSPANIFLKGILGIEIIVFILILILQL